MKARMKKLISISMPMVGLALLVVLGVALADEPARDPVTIYGSEVDLTASGGPFGNARFTIRDEEFVGTVLVLTGDTEERGDEEDWWLYAPEAVHIFDFGVDGSFTTVGAEHLVPTDEDPLIWIVQGDMEITEASGVFEGVSGELRVIAKVNRHPDVLKANFQANGVVCGYGD